MKRLLIVVMFLCAIVGLSGLAFAAEEIAGGASQAIDHSQMFLTDKRESYLIDQARGFLNQKRYDDAQQVARYILTDVNRGSQDAQNIIDQITQETQHQKAP